MSSNSAPSDLLIARHHIDVESSPWAMDDQALQALIHHADGVYTRTFSLPWPEALEAYRAARHRNSERAGVRGKTGIVYAAGPLLKRESWMSHLIGASTYDVMHRDFCRLRDDPDIKSIAIYVDSPGGEANGCDELAKTIYLARGKKPITAYVSGQACSAAYWIASAADRIVCSDAAMVGSIGVAISIADDALGVRRTEFVSSQSPKKRPNLQTDAGRAVVQQIVDTMAGVFIAAVAKYRNVSVDTVTKKFGAGGIEIGANAVKAGMADELGSFDAILAKLQAGSSAKRVSAALSASPAAAAPQSAPKASGPTAEELARAAKIEAQQRQAKIDAEWKRAADQASFWLPSNAVKSTN